MQFQARTNHAVNSAHQEHGARKWQVLQKAPLFSLANPIWDSEAKLIEAGRDLLEQGADVLMLDCLGFHQRHRDLLQKTLDVPVLLSNVLVARLASELLA
jgi:protein AroM